MQVSIGLLDGAHKNQLLKESANVYVFSQCG